MDSVLSGYSQNYSGTQIGQGQGYTGNVGTTGSAASGSAQGVDVTQLQPGDTFQGEIVSVNGEDVQIQLANGQYMAAKLERDVQLALGQVMNLQVQSNQYMMAKCRCSAWVRRRCARHIWQSMTGRWHWCLHCWKTVCQSTKIR